MKISHIMFGGVAFAVIAETFLLASVRGGEEDWVAYRDAHHCTPVAVTDGSNRAGWKCDDGKVHYRWRQMR
jgi:hypothetical protein